MRKKLFILLLAAGFFQTSQAQFVVKETEFEWFTYPSSRCAVEAIVPKSDGTVEINTFTQTLSAVMIQSGVFAGSAAPLPLYHSGKGFALDAKQQNLYLFSINPQSNLQKLSRITLW